jgi:hypothetical protein
MKKKNSMNLIKAERARCQKNLVDHLLTPSNPTLP